MSIKQEEIYLALAKAVLEVAEGADELKKGYKYPWPKENYTEQANRQMEVEYRQKKLADKEHYDSLNSNVAYRHFYVGARHAGMDHANASKKAKDYIYASAQPGAPGTDRAFEEKLKTMKGRDREWARRERADDIAHYHSVMGHFPVNSK